MKKLIQFMFLGALVAGPASAEISLHYTGGGGRVLDTDLLGLGDLDASLLPLTFDVVYDGLVDVTGGSGVVEEFGVSILDTAELTMISSYLFNPAAIATLANNGSSVGPTGIFQAFSNAGQPLAAGSILATFSVTPGTIGQAPHDELGDLQLFGQTLFLAETVTVFDPATGGVTGAGGSVSYDAQVVPIPAAVWLFACSLGLTGYLGVRKKSA